MSLYERFPQIFDKSKMPNVVYHYTTIEGFYGIAESKSIWAHDYRCLNDIEEMMHIYRLIPSEIDKNWILEHAIKNELGMPNYLILSFSEKCDDIAMWGRYTSDKGLALGLSKGVIETANIKEDMFQRIHVGKCIYSDSIKREIIRQVLVIGSKHGLTRMAQVITELAPFMKNESFANEKEWRIVFAAKRDHTPVQGKPKYGIPEYRVRNNTIVPYMNVEFGDSMEFESIVMSPILRKQRFPEIMIRNFLKSKSINIGAIRKSESSLI